MSRSIDYRSTSTHPADAVYAAMVDRNYLTARLAKIGGPGAEILEYAADDSGVRYRLKHGLDEKDLPGAVRSFLKGDIVVEREETWTPAADGSYAGTVGVRLPGLPAGAQGTMKLTPTAGGSAFDVHIDTKVNVPIIGGKIEATVGDQIKRLLAMEAEFTHTYLDSR
ncbi:MAG: DUF2505 domain-containing protein [Pseudonocardia sp.]|nr:DUF2505 domain-containing protein [Pseudonocardia sp.]